MSRWIRVQTSIFDHEAFADEPFSEREAWLWLIANAAWKDTHHRIGNQMVDVPAGSLFVTLRHLQTEWKWKSDFRVRSFLNLLQKQEMVSLNSNAGKTQITICNYSHYQNVERDENAKETHGKRTENALKTPVHQDTNTSSLRSEGEARSRAPSPAEIDQVVSAFSAMAKLAGLSVPRAVTASRRRSLALRIEEHGLPVVLDAIERIGRSRFCRGENDRGWRADLDFLCQPSSFVSIIEGKYDDRQSAGPSSRAPPAFSSTAKPGQTREEYLASELRRSERSFQ